MKYFITIVLTLLSGLTFAATPPPPLLLDYQSDAETVRTSLVPYKEILVQQHTFTTTEPNQVVRFDISAQITIHTTINANTNGSFRVYLNGDGYRPEAVGTIPGGSFWNGEILCNGGQASRYAYVSGVGRVACVVTETIPTPGVQNIYIHYGGSTTYTIGTWRGRSQIQVTDLMVR